MSNTELIYHLEILEDNIYLTAMIGNFYFTVIYNKNLFSSIQDISLMQEIEYAFQRLGDWFYEEATTHDFSELIGVEHKFEILHTNVKSSSMNFVF